MAALPKVDSAGLRLAKTTSAERVSSVRTVTKEEVTPPVRQTPQPARSNETVNGSASLPTRDRRPSGP